MGALEYLFFCTGNSTRPKRRSMQTVDIKVKMDCDGCERKVKNAVKCMKGVKAVEVNRKQNRVTVNGFVDPKKVLEKVNNTGKKAELWPYIPYNAVRQHADFSQVYDKRAPSGFAKKVITQMAVVSVQSATDEERLTYMFNDDNTNACSIM